MRRLLLALVLLATGCSGESAATTVLDDPDSADVVIELVYAEGFVTGVEPVERVSLGETVTVTIVSDTADAIHIHGAYDLFFSVPRAREVSFSFVADRAGSFQVELESLGYALFELEVG